MKFLSSAPRYLLGLVYFVFGLNGFLQFIPVPPLPEGAANLMGAFASTGYFFPLLKGTEVIGGLLLLSGRFVPLALVVLAPITVQIFFFHAFLTPGLQNIVVPVVMCALHVSIAVPLWPKFQGLFENA